MAGTTIIGRGSIAVIRDHPETVTVPSRLRVRANGEIEVESLYHYPRGADQLPE
jgi:hypothetical protein